MHTASGKYSFLSNGKQQSGASANFFCSCPRADDDNSATVSSVSDGKIRVYVRLIERD